MDGNKIRLPLAVPTTPRNGDSNKDPLLKNAYIDSSSNGITEAVKRPGFFVGSEAITTGTNRGVFVNPNNPSGGTAGQTQIWFIGGDSGSPTLSSFSTNGEA